MRPRTLLFASALLVFVAAPSPMTGGVPIAAQAQEPSGLPADLSSLKNFLPLEKPANLKASVTPDLSGAWMSAPYQSISMADRPGRQRGKEEDIDYKPWARAKTLSEVTPTGPEAEPHRTTDPWTRYCEPNGPVRVYAQPGRTLFRTASRQGAHPARNHATVPDRAPQRHASALRGAGSRRRTATLSAGMRTARWSSTPLA